MLLRLYWPLELWFDKTWMPSDFELVKWSQRNDLCILNCETMLPETHTRASDIEVNQDRRCRQCLAKEVTSFERANRLNNSHRCYSTRNSSPQIDVASCSNFTSGRREPCRITLL